MRPVYKPVQAESEIAYAERRVKPLARLLRCTTALRVTPLHLLRLKEAGMTESSLSARPPGPNAPVCGVVKCY